VPGNCVPDGAIAFERDVTKGEARAAAGRFPNGPYSRNPSASTGMPCTSAAQSSFAMSLAFTTPWSPLFVLKRTWTSVAPAAQSLIRPAQGESSPSL